MYQNLMGITKPQGFCLAVCCFGGDKRDRTADLLNAIQTLSQLSYTPVCRKVVAPQQLFSFLGCLTCISYAGCFTGDLLSQLSYTPIFAAFQSACVLYQYSCGLSRGFYKKCKKSFRGVFKVEDGGRTVGVIPYDARTLPGAVYPHQSRERVRREKDDRPGGRSLRGAGG